MYEVPELIDEARAMFPSTRVREFLMETLPL